MIMLRNTFGAAASPTVVDLSTLSEPAHAKRAMTSIDAVLRCGRSKGCMSLRDRRSLSHAFGIISRSFTTLLRCCAHGSNAYALQFVISGCLWKLAKASRRYTCLNSPVMEEKRSWTRVLLDTIFAVTRWKLWIFLCGLFCSNPDHL